MTLAPPSTAYFSFTVSAGSAPISDLALRFAAEHAYASDLNASLQSPQGTTLDLFAGPGLFSGGTTANFADTVFYDGAAMAIADGGAPFAGVYQPNQLLSTLLGEDPSGTWILAVTDTFPADAGDLLAAGASAAWGTALGPQLVFRTWAILLAASNPCHRRPHR